MDINSRPPNRIVESALFATVLGSLLGTSVLLGIEAWRSPESLSSALHLLGLGLGGSLWAGLIGLLVVAIYAAPLMALLRRIGFGGPALALAVGLLPSALLFLVGQLALAKYFLAYGLSVALVFCWFAYRQQPNAGDRL